jgi:hypothetical protein
MNETPGNQSPIESAGATPDNSTAPAPGSSASAEAANTAETKADLKQLTPEEQMALFEKELKENDWGHQPC